MEKITVGLTNQSFKDKDTFLQYKNINEFNHKINYSLLNKFEFVPNLIEDNDKVLRWEYISGKDIAFDDKSLIEISKILSKLHTSNLEFPPFNIRKRVNAYRQELNKRNIKIEIIDKYFKRINKILSAMDKNTPVHNDLYTNNFIQSKGRIYLIDWEYATLGDKHFDLAYFIEGAQLDDEQENVILDNYGSYDYEKLIQHKILVNYLVILWVNVQPIKYFDDEVFIKRVVELNNYLTEYRLK
ncbi:thiamine kinase-like enzyme [Mycoplasma testudineum]|uniref:Thiamine kinase-like enzyme n=1 Tax=Mycoplasma testudineum TaxID=244584 RepID=A0A4R6IH83_9MOLU|nr:phosphotransferase [Mycoplasma testudineum]OYD26860.1 hypothetical protein CG473_01985 [Mycoplasma testudineum]TDO20395.1 thiamine kinase-like enzyme [Mycoplasma testudineum]